jgi:hypothetical protein
MHRLDICSALDLTPQLSPEHDGIIVADVVNEWAQRHGKDFTLRLTGPAGGEWTVGTEGPRLELDAIDFCRVISKRPGALDLAQLMSTEVPY